VSGFLLDANVLIALAWPTHSSHAAVQHWFGRNARLGWATCRMTECAFVRIISNPAFSPHALSPQEALAILGANLTHPSHRFWPDDLRLLDAANNVIKKLTGHQQLTDAYLLGLAVHHRGKLATLDQGIAALAGRSGQDIELIQ